MTSEDQKTYHRSLHELIWSCTKLADWIYHDVRLDCDGDAGSRMAERLGYVVKEHGEDALFGILASWAMKAVGRIEEAIRLSGGIMPTLQTVLGEDVINNVAELDIEERARMSAYQFVTAIGNDDLEMGEAIFGAAANASPEDLTAFVVTVLEISINISNQARDNFPD